ncbi:hypothetical protein SynRS9907_02491 [Synechococcus sp. RS9907]|nr:hypothetical protein SynRS9907_02491 [Synechococcus sp. RS9907]
MALIFQFLDILSAADLSRHNRFPSFNFNSAVDIDTNVA